MDDIENESEDGSAIEPFLLVQPFLQGQLGVLYVLGLPRSVALRDEGFVSEPVEVYHGLVDEDWEGGLG